MNIETRNSTIEEAKSIATLLKRSILEICGPDYGNDRSILGNWIENKTERNVKAWIDNENTIAVTAYLDLEIVGFGLSNSEGEILLLYVLPENKGNGVGSSIYLDLENQLVSRNIKKITAYSTITAKPFYQNKGFTQIGTPIKVGGIDGEFLLEKDISK